MPDEFDSSTQHVSHRGLVTETEFPEIFDAQIDAIIVPSARPATSITAAIRLADELNRPLLVLCSRGSSREAVIAQARRRPGRAEVIAIDVDPAAVRFDVRFRTNELLADGEFRRTADTSVKRNLGVLIALSQGWQRILFLDDDIEIADAGDVRRAGSILTDFAVVGMKLGGFPDNSVVCHANRRNGNRQDTFIGAGAMVVNLEKATSFFPRVYNEDWLFLLEADGLRPLTITPDVTAVQKAYDPFADPARAAQEEFGDVIAEGIFGLLDEGRAIHDANLEFWRTFLRHRANFIKKLARQARRRLRDDVRRKVLASLDAALASLGHVTAEFCADYLSAWRQDLDDWQQRVERARRAPRLLEVALKDLGLDGCSTTLSAIDRQPVVRDLTISMQMSGDSIPMPASSYTTLTVSKVCA